MYQTLSDMIRLYREIGTACAREKIYAKSQKIDHKVRQTRTSYTNAKINRYKQVNSAIRNKHK